MVAKENLSSEKPSPTIKEVSRRDFMKMGLGVLSTIAALEIVGGSLMYLRAKSLDGKFGGTFLAGKVENFPNNSVTEFKDGNFFLVRAQDGGFLALYRRCPHLGCAVEWSPTKERFACPCHASSFDMTGDFISQPVPKALDLFTISFREDEILVDTSQVTRRDTFSPDQVTYYHL